jgi:hypothetical protein
MKPQLLIAAALSIVVLVGPVHTAPAGAASISFIELSEEGSTILLLTSGLGSFTASVGSESATVTVGTATATSVPLLSIGLTDSGGISDLISARAFISGTTLTGAYQVSFESDTEGALTAPPGVVTTLIPEMGLPQVVFSGSLPLVGVDLTITALSDLEPVPEPTTLLLFGTTIASMGLLARWRRGGQR